MNNLNFDLVTITSEDLAHQTTGFKGKLTKALHDGIFYVQIPSEWQMRIEAAQLFAEKVRFHKETLLKFNSEPYIGYQERTGTQTVAFVAKRNQWKEAFSNRGEIEALASDMHRLAVKILVEALENLEIPKECWEQATGGLTQDKGMIVFTTNHYQPGSETIGLPAHTDIGWITLLYVNQDGLKAIVDGHLTPIPPKDGFFVGNFGKAFEILVNNPSKLPACIHQVDKVVRERISFGLFINHQEDSDMCQMGTDGKLVVKQSYQEYLDARLKEFAELQKQALLAQSK